MWLRYRIWKASYASFIVLCFLSHAIFYNNDKKPLCNRRQPLPKHKPKCLVMVDLAEMKHHVQKQVKFERVDLAYTDMFLFMLKGSRYWNHTGQENNVRS